MSLVVNGYVKGFAKVPGRNAGYRAGRIIRRQAVRHITAGACGGDRSVIARGYATFYIPRDPGACPPGATQYAELDAVTYGACEWNSVSVHVEVEALTMDTTFTAYQIDRCGLAVAACIESGIADKDWRLAGGARYSLGTVILGFVDHQDLQHRACDMHSDGWNQWPAIRKAADKYLGGAVPDESGDSAMYRITIDSHTFYTCVPGAFIRKSTLADTENIKTVAVVSQTQFDAIEAICVPGFGLPAGGPGGGLPADWEQRVEDAAFRGAQRAEDD